MAVQQSVSEFFQKNKAKVNAVINKHKDDEIRTGIVQLPSGIRSGIAELKQCYFKSDENKMWFRAMGVVEAPDSVNGIPVKGLQTSIMVTIRTDTDANMEADLNKVREELCKLAGENLFAKGGDFDLPEIARLIQTASPPVYFRFSTSDRVAQADNPAKGVKKGQVTGVWENWHGRVKEYKSAVVVGGGVNVATAPTANGHAAVVPPTEVFNLTNAPDGDDEDLDALAARAGDDIDTQDRLREMAAELGYTDDDCDNATSWEQVVGWIRSGKSKAGGGEDDEKRVEPKKGDPVSYSPMDPKDKTKTRRLKAADCEIVKVNKKDETANLRRLDDKTKTYENVPWSELKYDS